MGSMDSVVRDVLVAARAWSKAREKCRRLADSKSAKPEQVEASKRELVACSDALFKSVVRFESFLRKQRNARTTKPVDWNRVFGAVSVVAQALETTVARPKPFRTEVIDTTGEEV